MGVINEPTMGTGASKEEKDNVHDFLDEYFDEAIKRVREILPSETPVVLFSWIFDFWRWPAHRFPYSEYGNVLWDTHIYTFWRDDGTSDDVDHVLSLYDEEIEKSTSFQSKQNASVVIGEFTFANFKADRGDTDAWQRMVDSLFAKFEESGLGGALLWSWDSMSGSVPWSMESMADIINVQWNL